MERFVVREPRQGAEYPQGNQMIAHSTNTAGSNSNNMIPQENLYFGAYAAEFPNMPHNFQRVSSRGFMNVPHVNVNSPFAANMVQGQSHVMSGIDPRYLGAYADNSNTAFIATGQQNLPRDMNQPINQFGDYQNRSFTGPDRKAYLPITNKYDAHQKDFSSEFSKPITRKVDNKILSTRTKQNESNVTIIEPVKKPTEFELLRSEVQKQMVSRSDKLKALHKSGPRAFSGPVEKVLKWHKSLQDIGLLVLYEVVAKCVSVRPGETCAKNLVVRDDNGPAIQVVYYEIDYLLPELKPPCTIRVIGRMLAGTCRIQAFSVRPATSDDVATLPRRAAVAAHHVAKLCKEYGTGNNN